MNRRKTNPWADLYTVLAVAAFLLVTALGNAIVMFGVGAFGFLLGLLIFRKSFFRVGTLTAVASCVIAVIVAWALNNR